MKIKLERQVSELKVPAPEQVRGWLGQETGRYFKSLLNEKIEELKELWINGTYTDESIEKTIQRNSEAVGMGQAYADVLLTLDEMCIDEEVTDQTSGTLYPD
jgi:hypothetical protein